MVMKDDYYFCCCFNGKPEVASRSQRATVLGGVVRVSGLWLHPTRTVSSLQTCLTPGRGAPGGCGVPGRGWPRPGAPGCPKLRFARVESGAGWKPVREQGLILKAPGPTQGHGVMCLAHNNTNHRKIQSPAAKLQNIKSQETNRLETRVSQPSSPTHTHKSLISDRFIAFTYLLVHLSGYRARHPGSEYLQW